ncbi:MAG: helix-turn-helix transcriptional regulator [Clostridia bacterium]|nr:helix-turn-helix transcriptional regulator [Clostridia bacterium]
MPENETLEIKTRSKKKEVEGKAEPHLVPECQDQTHEQISEWAKSALPSESGVEKMSKVYKMLAEPSRLRIVIALLKGELCVQHILSIVGGSQSALSHQLRSLKDNRLLVCRREGANVFYRLADEHIEEIVAKGLEHLTCEDA